MAPLFEHYGVQLWMPEAGGRVDYGSEHDEQAMTVLGLSSKREVTRASIRRVGHLRPPRAPGAGQRVRLHRRPGHYGRPRPARRGGPGRAGTAAVPAGRAPRLRGVRAADGISLGQRESRRQAPAKPPRPLSGKQANPGLREPCAGRRRRKPPVARPGRKPAPG
jgi:hypothetical protein